MGRNQISSEVIPVCLRIYCIYGVMKKGQEDR